MVNANRVNEIVSQITAFGNGAYSKDKYLPELLNFQQQLVEVVFNGEHADLASLKIYDVEEHLSQLNASKGNIADEELADVLEMFKTLSNLISSEIAGCNGEKKAFWALQKVSGFKLLLKNIELSSEEHRTEIDAILLTRKAIFIVEVKNPRKDIMIDEHGNYYKMSGRPVFDNNIGEKMTDKTYLLREALHDTGNCELNIESMIVFANNEISVRNNYPYVKTCFLSELTHLIENYDGSNRYNDDDLQNLAYMIDQASCKEVYPPSFDVDKFKINFATLVAKLEEVDAPETVCEIVELPVPEEREPQHTKREIVFTPRFENPFPICLTSCLTGAAFARGVASVVRSYVRFRR